MGISKEEIRKVLKIDAVAATLKLMSIMFIPIALVNTAIQTPMWYATVFIDTICIAMYKWRTSYVRKQFESYTVIYARIVRINKISFSQGTRRLTYSYEYKSHEYMASSAIADFLRHSYSIKEGDLIKIIVSADNPEKCKVIDLFS